MMEINDSHSSPRAVGEYVSVAVRPIVEGVIYAIIKPKSSRSLDSGETQELTRKVNLLLVDVIGVSGGTTQRISAYELLGYFVDYEDLVNTLPVVWRQFRAATRRIHDLTDCTLSLVAHVGTVYVEEFVAGDRRKFETSGETVEYVRNLGKYVPDDRIWVTQSSIRDARRSDIGAAYVRVSKDVP